MAENNPFIRLGDDADQAPRLNYSVPESTNYVGTSAISIDVDQTLLNADTVQLLKDNRKKKKENRPSNPIDDLKPLNLKFVAKSKKSVLVPNKTLLAEVFEKTSNDLIYVPREDSLGFGGAFDLIAPTAKPVEQISPKILFFEKLQISNFLGNYGAGRVIKTFSLFPGEKTKISLKSYQKTITTETTKRNAGSSIIDSVTEEAAADFENSIASETSLKHNESEADILNSQRNYSKSGGEGSASVLWGLVDAKGKGEKETDTTVQGEWGTRSAREEFAKAVSNALSKHTSRASSKRDVEINTSSEESSQVSTEAGEERSIERVIENVNVSRTLNLVFRQMIQEYVSVLHLVDVKIALYDESGGPYPQYAIHELDKFLDRYIAKDAQSRASIRNGIIRELFFIFNYRDQAKQFLEKAELQFPTETIAGLNVKLPDAVEYLRVRKNVKEAPADREFIKVDGVILAENVIAMRTEGVVVDAFLGQGEALDAYSQGLQTEAVREHFLKNALQEAEAEKIALAQTIISNNNAEQARLFREVYCCCKEEKKPDQAVTEGPQDGSA